jgi:nitrite reductase/ring-hydroxylating ferredoxin subunit
MQPTSLSANDIPAGTMVGVRAGGKDILVANVDGKYYAIGNSCTHRACTVSDGTLDGAHARCPCHGSAFDVRTGEVVHGPATKPEPSYKVEVSGDQISITV